MVLSTVEIPQLQFLNEVIDVPGMQIVQVLPSRLPVCPFVQRQVPSAAAVHQQGRLHPCRGAVFDPRGSSFLQTIDSPVAVHKVVDVPVVLVVRVGRALCTGTGPGVTPATRAEKGWRGRRES